MRAWEVVLLILISILAIAIRSSPTGALQGRYVQDGDSYRYLRLAEAELAGTPIGGVDRARNHPSGLDRSKALDFHPRLLAASFRATAPLSPRSSFRSYALRYPVWCFIIALLLTYGFVRTFASPGIARLSTLGLAVTPITVDRSVIGFLDRDIICLIFMVILSASWCAMWRLDRHAWRLAASGICGLGAVGLLLCWEGSGLILLPLVLASTWCFVRGSVPRSLMVAESVWRLVAIGGALVAGPAYLNFREPHVVIAIGPLVASLAFIVGCYGPWNSSWVSKYGASKPGMIRWATVSGTAALVVVVAASFLRPDVAIPAKRVLDNAVSTFGSDPLWRSVGELRQMTLRDWGMALGLIVVPFAVAKIFIARLILGERYRLLALITATLCCLLIYVSNDLKAILPAGAEYWVPGGFRIIALTGWWSTLTVLLYMSRHDRSGLDRRVSFPAGALLLNQVILLFFAAAGANRHLFFLVWAYWCVLAYSAEAVIQSVTAEAAERWRLAVLVELAAGVAVLWSLWTVGIGPVRLIFHRSSTSQVELIATVLISALAVVIVTQRLSMRISERRIAVPAFVAVVFAAVVLVEMAADAKQRARTTLPDSPWLVPFLERQSAPERENEPLVAWWPFGSRINVLAKRSTVVDEEPDPQRVKQLAREVFCTSDPSAVRRYFTEHAAHDWLIVAPDIFASDSNAQIAGVSEFPGAIKSVYFSSHGPESSETEEAGLLLPSGPANCPASDVLSADRPGVRMLRLSGLRLQAADEQVGSENAMPFKVQIDGVVGRHTVSFVPDQVYFEGRRFHQPHPSLKGTVVIEVDPSTGNPHGLYLSYEMSRLVLVRLFLLGDKLDGFRLKDETNSESLWNHRAQVWDVLPL